MADEFEGKIDAEGKFEFTRSFWKTLKGTFALPQVSRRLTQAAAKKKVLDWYDIRHYPLDTARDDEYITGFPRRGGDCILVLECENQTENQTFIKFDNVNSDAFDLAKYRKLRHNFSNLYLTNIASPSHTLHILFGRGDWEVVRYHPEEEIMAINADTVDGLHASTSVEPGSLLALGADGFFPCGAVRCLQNELFANLPAAPVTGDVFISNDTGELYICFVAGVWTNILTPSADQIAFTPAGGIVATDVQAAIEELDAEKIADIPNVINDTHIDWGVGVNQVSAADMPIADPGAIIVAVQVEGALQEIFSDYQAGGVARTLAGDLDFDSNRAIGLSDIITTGPWVDVRAFGAVGDGIADDTTAIQDAADYAGSLAVAETPIHRCSIPVLYFPTGKYKISDEIVLPIYVLVWGAKARIYQSNAAKSIFKWETLQCDIQGIIFEYGTSAIRFDTGGVDACTILISHCHFLYQTDYSVYAEDGSASTLLVIDKCRFYTPKVLRNTCNQAVFKNSWVSTREAANDTSIFYNSNTGVLYIENMLGVPMAADDYATIYWIENHGSVSANNTRFGGEGGGFNIIKNEAVADVAYPVVPTFIAINNSDIYAGAGRSVFYLNELPNQICLRDCHGMLDTRDILALSPALKATFEATTPNKTYSRQVVDIVLDSIYTGILWDIGFSYNHYLVSYISGRGAPSIPSTNSGINENLYGNRQYATVANSSLFTTSGLTAQVPSDKFEGHDYYKGSISAANRWGWGYDKYAFDNIEGVAGVYTFSCSVRTHTARLNISLFNKTQKWNIDTRGAWQKVVMPFYFDGTLGARGDDTSVKFYSDILKDEAAGYIDIADLAIYKGLADIPYSVPEVDTDSLSIENGNYVSSAAPTQGVFEKGMRVFNSSPDVGEASSWCCVNRKDTQIRVQATAAATIIEVDATAGMLAGDVIGITLDDDSVHWSTISSITDADTLVIGDGIPAGRNAPVNADIYTNRWKISSSVTKEWTDWTPTITDLADLSGYTNARYIRIGKTCWFRFTAENKNVTTAGTIRITLPFTTAAQGETSVDNQVHNGTAWVGTVFSHISPGISHVDVAKDAAGAGWAGTENGVTIRLEGFFEIA